MRALYYKYLFCKYFFSKSKTSIEYIHRYVHLCVGEHRDQNQVSFLPLHINLGQGFLTGPGALPIQVDRQASRPQGPFYLKVLGAEAVSTCQPFIQRLAL